MEVLLRLGAEDLLQINGDRWTFRSALVREVAYGRLTKSVRAIRHLEIAQAIEGLAAERDDRAELIGSHYAAAAELSADVSVDMPADLSARGPEPLGEIVRRQAEAHDLVRADRGAYALRELHRERERLAPADRRQQAQLRDDARQFSARQYAGRRVGATRPGVRGLNCLKLIRYYAPPRPDFPLADAVDVTVPEPLPKMAAYRPRLPRHR